MYWSPINIHISIPAEVMPVFQMISAQDLAVLIVLVAFIKMLVDLGEGT